MTGRGHCASFVGREDELGRLHRVLRSAAAGEPVTLLVSGEAGVGKTLVAGGVRRPGGHEAQVLLGRCLQLSGGGLPFARLSMVARRADRQP